MVDMLEITALFSAAEASSSQTRMGQMDTVSISIQTDKAPISAGGTVWRIWGLKRWWEVIVLQIQDGTRAMMMKQESL